MLLSRAASLSGIAVGLVSAFVVAGCGGDKSGDRDGTGGSSMGGSSASGGTSNATGGSGGGSTLTPYPCEAKALPGPAITETMDATGKWGDGKSFGGGSFTYGDGPDDGTAVDISIDYSNHAMHITGKSANYTGFGLWFGPAGGQMYPCIDAGAYSGVSFKIIDNGGTVSEIKSSVQTHATAPIDVANKRGGCVFMSESSKYSDCIYPGATVKVPADGVVEVPWADFVGGKPDALVDGKSLDGLQWQFPWATGMTEYAIDVTVSDVKFY